MELNQNNVNPIYIREMMEAEPMTVGDLIKKLERMPKKAKVYMVFDKFTEHAWDEEGERWRYAIPLAYVSKEINYIEEAGWDKETNVILEVENP